MFTRPSFIDPLFSLFSEVRATANVRLAIDSRMLCSDLERRSDPNRKTVNRQLNANSIRRISCDVVTFLKMYIAHRVLQSTRW